MTDTSLPCEITLGDAVVWRSQAGGSSLEKRGLVAYMGPPRRLLSAVLRDSDTRDWAPGWKKELADSVSSARVAESTGASGILVGVYKVIGETVRNFDKPRFYSPRRSVLRVFRSTDAAAASRLVHACREKNPSTIIGCMTSLLVEFGLTDSAQLVATCAESPTWRPVDFTSLSTACGIFTRDSARASVLRDGEGSETDRQLELTRGVVVEQIAKTLAMMRATLEPAPVLSFFSFGQSRLEEAANRLRRDVAEFDGRHVETSEAL